MFPMKNLILGIEKTCLKPLFKPISIFEKKMNIGVEFWVSEFLRYFLHVFLHSKYAKCAGFAFLD